MAVSHKALSTGGCDGRDYQSLVLAVLRGHKALSTGGCDGLYIDGRLHICNVGHKALSTGGCDGHIYDLGPREGEIESQSPINGWV